MRENYNWPNACPEKVIGRSVFDRLTDHKHFTGIHRYRFDEFGNGRGRAGAFDLVLSDGFTRSSDRPCEVFSSSLKHPRPPVVEPGTLGVQKFGVQVTNPKMIWIFRNGDTDHDGAPLLIKNCYRSIEQVHKLVSRSVDLFGGHCIRLYDQNLQPVKDLRELVDGAKYLATSGEPPAPLCKLRRFLSPFVLC